MELQDPKEKDIWDIQGEDGLVNEAGIGNTAYSMEEEQQQHYLHSLTQGLSMSQHNTFFHILYKRYLLHLQEIFPITSNRAACIAGHKLNPPLCNVKDIIKK
jgi:hypothetical protein